MTGGGVGVWVRRGEGREKWAGPHSFCIEEERLIESNTPVSCSTIKVDKLEEGLGKPSPYAPLPTIVQRDTLLGQELLERVMMQWPHQTLLCISVSSGYSAY